MQLIILAVVLAGAGAAFWYVKNNEKKNKETDIDLLREKTAQEFVNAKEITENCLFTLDGNIFAFIKIEGISLELFSSEELVQLCKNLSSSLSKFRFPFKYIAVSRPVDVSKTMREYAEMRETAEGGRRNLLKSDMEELADMVMSGETLERQHYIIISGAKNEDEKTLATRARELAKCFTVCSIGADILDKSGIVTLCNLVNIPAYVHIESSSDVDAAITALLNE
ncbi:MAG: hypothetical protein LBR74_04245 [Eubacterium sp.]|jgi:tricorn protease-like protein|nr:hypothetical protein [Eubacterium sp.]